MGSIEASCDKIPLWIDCDPGHDDAFAILLAAYHSSMELLGISTVHGNSSLKNTTYNALRILEAIGRSDIPVFSGVSQPFCRPPRSAEDFHGASGLGGTELLPKPALSAPEQHNAIEKMREVLMATEEKSAWLVAIGPLTNVALLFATYPEVAAHIKGLSIMGGAIGSNFARVSLAADSIGKDDGTLSQGGTTPYAEFNVWCDPESAQSVFQNSILRPKIVLIPLDLTHQACAVAEVRQRLLNGRHGATRLRTTFYELIMFYHNSYASCTETKSGPPLHDILAVAALLFNHADTELNIDTLNYSQERWSINVILSGKQVGRTVVTPSPDEGSIIPRA
ncbi:uridine nucleosidase [Xylogone sp. PMI_703]|nr:uridine nucleosidase [Xylogone sp. PMI_703]